MPLPLIIGNHIGSGAYGAVHHAKWGMRKVAIKKFNLTREEAKQEASVKEEIRILNTLRDSHIIQFYGSDFHEGKLVLIMEYAEGGCLQSAIKKRLISDWATKERIAQEIARGLTYIHQEKILHRDLKSGNVLLTKHKEVKLCDFGLAKVKLTSVSGSTAGGDSLKGTFRWMAPELFAARPKYSTKSDIYALGMVMWEMAANNITPFHDQPDNYVVMGLVKSGEREELPDDTPALYRQLVERCWDQDPSKRPDAHELGGDPYDHEPEESEESTGDTVSISMDFSDMSFALPSQSSLFSQATLSSPSAVSSSASTLEGSNATTEELLPAKQQIDESSALTARAEGGDVEAQVELALMYERGHGGVKQSYQDAWKWYRLASEQGDARAKNAMGEYLYHGRGVPANEKEAKILFTEAANQGHALAQSNLGAMFGIAQEYGQAVEWFRKAAEQGDPEGQLKLGMMCLEGNGTKQNVEEALSLLEKAAAQGNLDAQFRLATLYETGTMGLEKSDLKAANLYLKAANKGHRSSMHNLGGMYLTGRGFKSNPEESKAWYDKFAKAPQPEFDMLKWPIVLYM